jgi:hypothetical protein
VLVSPARLARAELVWVPVPVPVLVWVPVPGQRMSGKALQTGSPVGSSQPESGLVLPKWAPTG